MVAALLLLGRVDAVGAVAFERPLQIPPLAAATLDAEGTRVFELPLQVGRAEVRNDLPEASNLHWHGLHLPVAADGGPHQMVATGGTWSPSWTVDQPAATAWYHPHGHGSTAEQIRRGSTGCPWSTTRRRRRPGCPTTTASRAAVLDARSWTSSSRSA